MAQNDITEDLERLKGVKPRKDPPKQWRADRLLAHIEQKMEDDGVTLADIHSALFSDLSYSYFKVMIHRARKKRERRSGGREAISRRTGSAREEKNGTRSEPGELRTERKTTRFSRQ